jgi:hypothetical protein
VSEDDFLGEDAKERTYATYNANPPYADARYVM